MFGSAVFVGIVGALNVRKSLKNYVALLLFVAIFAIVFVSMVYLVKRRKLKTLETG